MGGSDLVASGRHMGEEGIGLARGAHNNTRASPFFTSSLSLSIYILGGGRIFLFHRFLLTYSSSLQASREGERLGSLSLSIVVVCFPIAYIFMECGGFSPWVVVSGGRLRPKIYLCWRVHFFPAWASSSCERPSLGVLRSGSLARDLISHPELYSHNLLRIEMWIVCQRHAVQFVCPPVPLEHATNMNGGGGLMKL